MDIAMREDLVAAGMDEQQAEVLVSHLPDWSQLATKADLEQLATQMATLATQADLKDLALQTRDQMRSQQDQMSGLRENMAGLHENDISIQKELGSFQKEFVSLHQAVADIKSGWLVRLWVPAAVAIVTGITAGSLAVVLATLLS